MDPSYLLSKQRTRVHTHERDIHIQELVLLAVLGETVLAEGTNPSEAVGRRNECVEEVDSFPRLAEGGRCSGR